MEPEQEKKNWREGYLMGLKSRLVKSAGEILKDETGHALDKTIIYLQGAKKRLDELKKKMPNT